MYDEGYTVSERYAKSNRAFVESMIKDYETSIAPEKKKSNDIPYMEESDMILNNTGYHNSIVNRYRSFCQSVRVNLLTEAMCWLMNKSVDAESMDSTDLSIIRSMVSQYVNENGYDNILNRMKTASTAMSCMYKTITECALKVIKEADKEDPNTFKIAPEMKDDFYSQLDYSDSDAIADAIRDRVTDAMEDFVTANTKDHEDITSALQQAQEKINQVPEDDEELREQYNIGAKRVATEVRNRPKGVFHSMVFAMCESIMKNNDMHDEFMTEGHLNIEKVVNRTKLMYTFIEMLNTARIDNVNEVFIEQVIADLSK